MKQQTFNWEVQTLLEQFVSAFNDIIINRYDENKNLIDPPTKKVLYQYSPKSRLFNYLNNTATGGLTMPVVAVSISGISRDATRVYNKLDGFLAPYVHLDESYPYMKKIPQPVPINISVKMSIVTKYQNDMDQILSNFIPYCDPYIIISWKLPTIDKKFPIELRTEVLWDGQAQITYPVDLQGQQNYRINADCGFLIKGWLFKKMDEVYNKIYVINSDYSATDFDCNILTDIESLYTDYMSISARPQF